MATTTSRPVRYRIPFELRSKLTLELCFLKVIGKRGPLPDNTGWSAMDKIVRNHDKTVIQDFKEDIDTLLVFVGRRIQPIQDGYIPDIFVETS